MNNIAEIIRKAVTMKDICRAYGFTANRAGFIHCPFHPGDRDASLKIYPNGRGWHCFGCGKGGSVIDFVRELRGVGFNEAVRIINSEFRLNLFEKPTLKQYREMQKKEQQSKRQRIKREIELENAEKERQTLCDEFRRLHFNKVHYAPKMPGEEWNPLFVEALQKIDYQEYLLECAEKRIEVIKSGRNNNISYDDTGTVAE